MGISRGTLGIGYVGHPRAKGVVAQRGTVGVGRAYFPATGPPPGPVLWTPAEISADLAAWYSGSDLIMSGADVVGATDLSGNGMHATAVGVGTLSAADWNGTLAVVGSSTTRGLQVPVGAGTILAYYISADRLSDDKGCLLSSGTGSTYVGIYENAGSSSFAGFSGANHRINGSVSASPTRLTVRDAISSGGIFAVSWTSISGFTAHKICQYSGFGFEFAGRWGDAIFLKAAPTLANAQKIEGYLAWRRGTVAKLPVDHPYKLAPPYV